MLDSLLGAIVGGAFTLLGGWFAQRWQANHSAGAVAAALLAELRVADDLAERHGVNAFYQQLLESWKRTGCIDNRDAIAQMFDNDPQETLPVYYAMVSNLGLLPHAVGSAVVEYHAKVIALTHVVGRFLGNRELDPQSVQVIAHAVQKQLQEVTQLRGSLIAELSTLCGDRVGIWARVRTVLSTSPE